MNNQTTEGYTTADLNKVPLPPGAVEVDEWHGRMSERPGRFVQFITCTVAASEQPWSRDIEVNVQGVQYADGTLSVEIAVDSLAGDLPITAAQARDLAIVLALAAGEAEELTGSRR